LIIALLFQISSIGFFCKKVIFDKKLPNKEALLFLVQFPVKLPVPELNKLTIDKEHSLELSDIELLCKAFTIINFSAEGGPQRQILTATPRLYKTLYASHHSPQGPLDKPYWALSRSGVKQTTAYHLNAIKARDLKEDWSIDEEAAEALVAATQSYDNSVIRETSYAEVLEIAQSLS
jgi:hypothetical protein